MSNFQEGSDTIDTFDSVADGTVEIPNVDFAEYMLGDVISVIRKTALVSGASVVSFDEQRNKAIYYLNGEVVSNHAEDQEDVPFPWMDGISETRIEKINRTKNLMSSIVQFYLDNEETITVVEEE